MRKRSIVFVMLLSAFTMHFGFASNELNDNNTLEKQAEAQILASITYIEDEIDDEIDLGFNVHEYLPLDFDPYKGMIYGLDDIEYIESDEVLEL
ncbi:MAG: hypothetical protein AAGC45_07245 [Bacteroidota bacterium]